MEHDTSPSQTAPNKQLKILHWSV